MQTTTARDILSNDDIAATCGDADCATCDAEMTEADHAAVAAVDADLAAESPYATWPAEARAAQEALDAKRAADAAAYLAGAPARAEAARAALASKVTAGKILCPCCSRIVSVKRVEANGAIIVGKHGWKGQNNGRNFGRGVSGTNSKPCDGSWNAVLAA